MTKLKQIDRTPNKKLKPTVNSYSRDLRGPSQNRFGGHQSQNLRTYGGKRGPAGPVKVFTLEERKAVEEDLRKGGLL